MEPVQHGRTVFSEHIGNHRITGRLYRTICKTYKECGYDQGPKTSCHHRHDQANKVAYKCRYHEFARSNFIVEQASKDHGYREPKKAHTVYPTQLLIGEHELLPQLGQYSRSNSEGHGCNHQRNTGRYK